MVCIPTTKSVLFSGDGSKYFRLNDLSKKIKKIKMSPSNIPLKQNISDRKYLFLYILLSLVVTLNVRTSKKNIISLTYFITIGWWQ